MLSNFGRCATRLLKNKQNCNSLSQVNYFATQQQATYETEPFKLHNLDEGPSQKALLSRQDALKLYKDMSVIRRFQNATLPLYRERLIRGFLHLYVGQEAVCVGMRSVMRPEDACITTYRCHGWAYVMGMTVQEIIAELLGRVSGASRGKGGSMHFYGPNFYGGNGIVGSSVPVGTGIAFQMKYNNKASVCFNLYGDGAANQGQVFESFNMAKLWNLPVIYVCENNQFGMGTSTERSSANTLYYTRCEYIPGIWVNGMDVVATREAAKFAINYVTSGKGPIILEMDTYRYVGHSMSDPGTGYRTREDVEEVRKTRDPIFVYQQAIIASGLVTEEELKNVDKKIKEGIEKVVEEVKSHKAPGLEELTSDVYVDPLRSEERRVSPWERTTTKSFGKLINPD